MYFIALVIGIVFLILLLMSRRMKVPLERKGIWGTLDRASAYILRFVNKKRKKNDRNVMKLSRTETRNEHALISCLEQLSPGEEIRKLRETYVIQKMSMSMLVILLGTVLGVIVRYTTYRDAAVIDSGGGIYRDGYAGSAKDIALQVTSDDYEGTIDLTLQPRRLSDEELDELLPEFFTALEKMLIADNPSSEQISSNINPVNKVSGYPFSVRWGTSDYSLISPADGTITEVDEKCQVTMTAYIKYEGNTWEKEYLLTLIPREYSAEEYSRKELEKYVMASEEESRGEDVFVLPDEYNGKPVVWTRIVSDNSVFIWLAVVGVAITIYFLSDKDLEKKVEEKKRSMKKEYSDVVRKFALYIGAGMTVRSAFRKIAADAVDKDEKNPIYMEMVFACRELKSGISEEEAYERFGRRTGVQEYIRMSTLLQQNIKRGSADLLGRLKEEAANASIERLQACRKRGEEATTKLLLPMVLMLLIVMVIVMLPAFSSMKL